VNTQEADLTVLETENEDYDDMKYSLVAAVPPQQTTQGATVAE
jgi:hypothetical protein